MDEKDISQKKAKKSVEKKVIEEKKQNGISASSQDQDEIVSKADDFEDMELQNTDNIIPTESEAEPIENYESPQDSQESAEEKKSTEPVEGNEDAIKTEEKLSQENSYTPDFKTIIPEMNREQNRVQEEMPVESEEEKSKKEEQTLIESVEEKSPKEEVLESVEEKPKQKEAPAKAAEEKPKQKEVPVKAVEEKPKQKQRSSKAVEERPKQKEVPVKAAEEKPKQAEMPVKAVEEKKTQEKAPVAEEKEQQGEQTPEEKEKSEAQSLQEENTLLKQRMGASSPFQLTVSISNQTIGTFAYDQDSVSIGRDSSCDVVIDNLGASRVHAKIERVGRFFVLYDMESKTGTFIKGKRIQEYSINSGDEIFLAKHTITFQKLPPDAKVKIQKPKGDASQEAHSAHPQMMLTMAVDFRGMAKKQEPIPAHLLILKMNRRFPITKNAIFFGKSSDCDFQIGGFMIGERHAMLVHEEKGFILYNLGLFKAPKVNRIAMEKIVLQEGDMVEIGDIQFVFQEGGHQEESVPKRKK